MDTTENEIRNLFANKGELDRDEIALLLLQLVERIQNLENAKQRTLVWLTEEQIVSKAMHLSGLGTSPDVLQFARAIEAAVWENMSKAAPQPKQEQGEPQQRTWVGLSREDCYQVRENESDDFMYGVAWAESKLKDKNT